MESHSINLEWEFSKGKIFVFCYGSEMAKCSGEKCIGMINVPMRIFRNGVMRRPCSLATPLFLLEKKGRGLTSFLVPMN